MEKVKGFRWIYDYRRINDSIHVHLERKGLFGWYRVELGFVHDVSKQADIAMALRSAKRKVLVEFLRKEAQDADVAALTNKSESVTQAEWDAAAKASTQKDTRLLA